jgi:hypothetical protein
MLVTVSVVLQRHPRATDAIGRLIAIVCLALMGTQTAAGAVIRVPDDAPTIAAAIELAVDGDVIELAPGFYGEPFTIGAKAIALRGDESAPSLVLVAPTGENPWRPVVVTIAPDRDGDGDGDGDGLGVVRFSGLTIAGPVLLDVDAGRFELEHALIVGGNSGIGPVVDVDGAELVLRDVTILDAGYEFGPSVIVATDAALVLDDVRHLVSDRGLLQAAGSSLEATTLMIDGVRGFPSVVTLERSTASIAASMFTNLPGPGAILASGSDVVIADTTFVDVGDEFGGAPPLDLAGDSIAIVRSTFIGCGGFASPAQAGVLVASSILIDECIVRDSALADTGCGGFVLDGDATVRGSFFERNSTLGLGGALVVHGTASIEDCLFRDNVAGDGDGALSVHGDAVVVASQFIDNIAGDDIYPIDGRGGAIGVRSGGTLELVGCLVAGNRAGGAVKLEGGGGAVAVVDGALAAVETLFVGNQAIAAPAKPDVAEGSGLGGALLLVRGSIALERSAVVGNAAEVGGGGIQVLGGDGPLPTLSLIDTTVCNNLPNQIAGTIAVAMNAVVCSCSGDVDGDGVVSAADVTIVLGAWGACAGCASDLDVDGVVGPFDLAIVLGAFGGCS